jgi:hypothetical protein
MIQLKNILAENMLRFGSKNLSESDRRKLQSLTEQASVSIDVANDAGLQAAIKKYWAEAIADPDFADSDKLYKMPVYIGKNFMATTPKEGSGIDSPTRAGYRFFVIAVSVFPSNYNGIVLPATMDTIVTVEKNPSNKITSINADPIKTVSKQDLKGVSLSGAVEGLLYTDVFNPYGQQTYTYLDAIKSNFASYAAAAIKNPTWKTAYNEIKNVTAKAVLDRLGYKPV